MELNKNTKIGLIGFGFLLEYLSPCYMRLYNNETIGKNVVAVTADEKQVEEKNRRYPFLVQLGGNLEMLKDLKPDIVLFAPPPVVAPSLIKNVLKPYYAYCQKNSVVFPDLYVFPPTPQGSYYIRELGENVHVCNILPNMMNEINGVSLNGKEGNTYLSFPDGHPWPEENRKRLFDFFGFIGNTIEVQPDQVLDMLGTLATHEQLAFLVYALCDALHFDEKLVAENIRAAYETLTGYRPKGTGHLREENSEMLKRVYTRILQAWTDGAVDFLVQVGMDRELAQKITVTTLDINLHGIQMQSREYTVNDLKNHATKGGVAEKGHMCYELLMADHLQKFFSQLPDTEPCVEFYQWIHDVIYQISKCVAIHGRRLSGSNGIPQYSAENHALLFTMFVRNAVKISGQEGKNAVEKGTALYAKQRGERMGQRTEEHGDPRDMLHYQIYGEWSAAPGELESKVIAHEPSYITAVSKCPWYTACQQYGYLEELKVYCSCIDRLLVQAYNKNLNFEVQSVRTLGDDECRFVWNGLNMNAENQKAWENRSKEIGDSCRRDWQYHTRHMFSAMSMELMKLEQGKIIVDKTLEDFEILYGAALRQDVEEGAAINFNIAD